MRFASVLAILSVLACSAFAENVKQIISSRYGEVTRAMQTHNLKPISAILSSDYKAIAPNGKWIGRGDILKQFQFQSDSVTDLKWPRKITAFKLSRDTAVVTVDGHLSANTKGKPKRKLDLIATTRDTWKKVGGKWLLTTSELLKSQMSMNGKPFHMGG